MDPAATRRAERRDKLVALAWFMLGIVALLVLWDPWRNPEPKTPSNVEYIGSPYADCQSAYEDDYHPAWGDPGAVKSLPGCSGWLPPPPQMLPGYDQDCEDISNLGPVDVGPFDPYELDADGDGIGCEPYER